MRNVSSHMACDTYIVFLLIHVYAGVISLFSTKHNFVYVAGGYPYLILFGSSATIVGGLI